MPQNKTESPPKSDRVAALLFSDGPGSTIRVTAIPQNQQTPLNHYDQSTSD